MKGLPIHAVAVKDILSIWISSPTGDSSDSYVHNITCHNESQAEALAEAYRNIINNVRYTVPAETQETLDNLRQTIHELRMWEDAHLAEITELKEKLDMYKFAYDSQRAVITELKEQILAGSK